MQELISPQGSEKLIAFAAIALLVIGAIGGARAIGRRGMVAGLVGPLVWILWQAHKWVTRYDARSGYFGLESVAVLLGEVVVFIALGWALGRAWNEITKTNRDKGDEGDKAQPTI